MAVLGITCRCRHEQGLRRGLTADRPRTGTAAPDAGRQAPPDSGRPSARAPGRKDRGEARAQGTAPEAMATAAGASESRPVMRSAPAGPPPTSRRALARTPSSYRHPLPVVTSRECRLSPASWWRSEKLLIKGNVVVVERGAHTGVLFCLGCTGGLQERSREPGRENAALAWPQVPHAHSHGHLTREMLSDLSRQVEARPNLSAHIRTIHESNIKWLREAK